MIRRRETNKEKEQKEFESDLREEFEDTMAELRQEYEKQMSEFNVKMKAYKLQRTRKVVFLLKTSS